MSGAITEALRNRTPASVGANVWMKRPHIYSRLRPDK
jgi:hypothetical protein